MVRVGRGILVNRDSTSQVARRIRESVEVERGLQLMEELKSLLCWKYEDKDKDEWVTVVRVDSSFWVKDKSFLESLNVAEQVSDTIGRDLGWR